jgi:aryl-alcohol dehydrogenase-like predicted oxidoreductase
LFVTAAVPLPTRSIGPFAVSAIGLGCMNLSHAYGAPPPPQQAEALLLRALELGITLFDTAALYGFGANEELLGRALAPYRRQITLASKCGMTGVGGKRVIDGRPETLRRTCDDSLRRLRTDVIDLYYLHRWDRAVPIEDSVGALSDLVRAGKVRAIGLSEVSAQTLRRAHAIHPIAALQSEYSLWTRNSEIAALEACKQIGAAFVAFSPLGRGFLGAELRDAAALEDGDIRRTMPRFAPEAYADNLRLLDEYAALAREAACTPAQLALAWLLARAPHVVPIPGTTRIPHLEQNVGALAVTLTARLTTRLDALISRASIHGARYSANTQAEIDTEEF